MLNNIANHYLASGKRSQAREFYLKTVAADPRHQNANLQLARISVEEKQGQRALTFLGRLGDSGDNEPGMLELRARALALAGKCADAGEIAKRLESLPDNDARAHFSAGAVYAECKLYEQAETSFSHALDANPQDPDIFYNLGLAALHAGHTGRAVNVFETALNSRPEDIDCLYALSQAYLKRERPVDAAALLARAVRLAPDRGDILLLLAQVAGQLGFYQDAAESCDRYLKLKPADEIARRERASALASMKKAGDSRPHTGLIEYLSLPPAEQRVRYLANLRNRSAADSGDFRWSIRLGTELLADEKTAEALEVFRKIRPATRDPDVLARCGQALAQFEQYAPARPFLEAAVSSVSNARLDLALTLFHLEGPEPALTELDKIPEADRKGDYYLLRAQLLDALNRIPEAAQALNRGMQAAPTRVSLYFQAASFLLKYRMNQEALALLEQASRIVPDERELLLAQWVTLILVHRDLDAQELLAKIQARWPEWDRPYLLNGILLAMQLRPVEARRSLETAIALGANTPETWYYQALVITRVAPEDWETAENAIARALALTSKDPYIYLLAGKISLARNDYSTAVRRLTEAVRLQPALVPAHYALRTSYKAIGDEQKAAAELEQINRIGREVAASDESPLTVENFLFTVRPPR